MPFSLSRIYLIYASNAIGVTSFPLVVSIVQSLLNVLGNLLGLTVFDLGVAGIGIATVISNLVGFIMYIIRFKMYFKEMGVDKEKFKFSWKYVGMSLPSAAPNSAQQFAMYLVGFLIAPIRNDLGYLALAALSIVSRIQAFISMFYGFCARTAANYIPQCVGAKKYDKIKKAIVVSFVQSLAYFIPLFFAVWLFPQAVCNLFINSETEPEVIEIVIEYIKIFMPFMLIHTISTIFHSVFRGIKSNQHLFISTMTNSLVGFVAALILCPIMGITGFYIQAIIGWAAECIYIAVAYFTGLWVPKNIRPFIHTKKSKLPTK
jgi:Na+-driven multidrug efflux pump